MVISALKKKKSARPIGVQTPEEQMYLLKLGAHQILGEKWIHYKKIKMAGSSGKLFKSKDLTEEMKATQSALKFTSKNATRLYRAAYQTTLKDIKSYTGSTEGFPELDDESEGDSVSALTSEFDVVIISYTPIKFLLPAKQIREKGVASQRHSEGLIAKLFFKVAAYYANPNNWDSHKLSFYLTKIAKDASFQDVAMALEPLKKDLLSFSEQYEPFKFGKAALSKDVAQDADTFDDAMEDESFESQVRTLYWHRFIYEAIELFLFRYYLAMVTATSSVLAMRYLTTIFEPALKQAIENRMVFSGSFDTDISRRQFQRPFEIYRRERLKDQLKKKIKTQKGVFEIFNYNLPLLQKNGIRHNFAKTPVDGSQWWHFSRQYILGVERPVVVEVEKPPAELEEEALQKQELEELKEEKTKADEAFHEADDALGELNLKLTDFNSVEKEKSLNQIKKSLAEDRENINNRLAELEANKNKLEERAEIINQASEGQEGGEGFSQEEDDGHHAQVKNLQLSKAEALKENESLRLEEEKLDKEERLQFKTDKELDEQVKELKIKQAQAGEKDLIQQEILEKLKEKKKVTENKKRIAEEKKEVYRRQQECKEKLEQIDRERRKLDQQQNMQGEEDLSAADGPQDPQNELAGIHTEIHAIDVEMVAKKKELTKLDQRTLKLEKNLVALQEKTGKLQNAIKLAEKNLQGPVKKREELSRKIEEIQEVLHQKFEAFEKAEEEARAKLGDLNSPETRFTALVHIITMIIKSARFQKTAKNELLNRFESRIAQDLDLAKKRIEEIKKESDKKLREMTRKVSKLKRMKQEDAVINFQKDIDTFKQKTDKKSASIIANSKTVASMQRKRLGKLQAQIEREKTQSDADSVANLLEVTNRAANDDEFLKEFKNFIKDFVSGAYVKELETFYRHLFEIVGASILDKVAIVQSLQKSAGGGVPVSLSESDLDAFGVIVGNMKDRINEMLPLVFEYSIDLYSSKVMINDLLNLRIDNKSMQKILTLKVSSPKNPIKAKLEVPVIKSLLSLNNLLNPVPFFNLLQPGKEKERDPLKSIDVSLLNRLITESKASSAKS